MVLYAQFQKLSSGVTFQDGKMVSVPQFLIDAVETDGVMILDGRKSIWNNSATARQAMNKDHNIKGFKIIKAKSFLEQGKKLYEFNVYQ